MRKSSAITIIALVGAIMITSGMPQDVFAGKNDVRLSLDVLDNKVKMKNVDCWADINNPEVSEVNHVQSDNSGNAAKVRFTFNDISAEDTVYVRCFDDNAPAEYTGLDKKNNRGEYNYLNTEP